MEEHRPGTRPMLPMTMDLHTSPVSSEAEAQAHPPHNLKSTSYPSVLTDLTKTSPEKTQKPPSSPERRVIRRRSGSFTVTTPGNASSTIDGDDEQTLGIDCKLSTLYTSAR
uniref:Uncharacterized protein n=1 Tax=Saccharum officinarum TaxID=4547 RepID=A0A678TPW8_SACOF|nr:hypothetical protein SO13M23_000013 [Saccharum officinarum]